MSDRLIDFLVSLCTCGDEQMPNIQKMICDELLNNTCDPLALLF